jgi:hypothetical protein
MVRRSSPERHAHRLRVTDDGHVTARPLDVGLAQRNDVLPFGNLALHVVEHLALDEDDRIVVSDGALEEALGVGRCRRHDDLETGDVGVIALEGLRVLRGELQRRAARAAKDRRHSHLSVRHVPHLGGVVHELVDGEEREVPGHELDDGPQAHHGGADADAGESELRDRRVHHAHGAELVEQSAAHLVRALVDADFLAHEEDVGVALHLLAERLVEGVAVGEGGHANSVLRLPRTRPSTTPPARGRAPRRRTGRRPRPRRRPPGPSP